jgi:TolB protein
MIDMRTDLKRASDAFGEPPFSLEDVRRKKVRRHRRRRIISATSALALAALTGSFLWTTFRPGAGQTTGPGVGALRSNGPMEGIRLGLVGSDGSHRRVIGDGIPEYLTGGWSPDGSKLVFSRDPEETPDGDVGIWMIDADGTDLTQLTDGSASDLDAQWSPDGTRILFRRSSDGRAPEIFVMNPDGSGVRRLSSDPGLVYLGARWSPDGQSILFIADTLADDGRTGLGIYVMRSDGTHSRRIYQGVNGTPQWAPDGDRILFQQEGSLATMSSDGTDIQPIAEGFGLNEVFWYRWSPDGSRVLYTRAIEPDRGEELWVAAVDGSENRLVAEGLQWRDPDPTWSPDGTMIAFVRDGDIWSVSVDGGEERRITNTPETESLPAWAVG